MFAKAKKILSAGGAAMTTIANPVNLLFVFLMVMAGLAVSSEQIILVGMISTLALLMGAVGAALLAMFVLSLDKTLSARGFAIFLAAAFIVPVVVWTPEIFNTIPDNQWLYVAGLAVIMLVFSLFLVPRLRRAYQAAGVLGEG